ncbi:MAG: elongation factor G [Proteobacteria bacterium]|nr:elongation factor G [Pseudomonadota bacterium]
MSESQVSAPRCVALVGSYLSGKTTLLESLLHACGAVPRKGTVKEGNTIGDSVPEARARQMSTELSVASAEFLGDPWIFIDCPGSIELAQETFNALMAADAAIVVCESEIERAMTVAPILKFLEDHEIPHCLFINKMDTASASVAEMIEALQAISSLPLVLRQVPIRDGEHVTGYVDLASERAYEYKPGEASDLIELPDSMVERKETARTELIEKLADFSDTLLEQFLEDVVPEKSEIYQDLAKDMAQGLIVPVLLGAGLGDHGVRRLLKLLRHEVPHAAATAARRGVGAGGDTLAQVFKTNFVPHAGKLSLVRVWRGEIKDGMTLNGARVAGLFRMQGHNIDKTASAGIGEVVALGRMDEINTGDVLTPSGETTDELTWPEKLTPVYALAVEAENRSDEVKLTGAIGRLAEEDPSLALEQNADTQQMLVWGQGELHLQIAFDRMANKANLKVKSHMPRVAYKETIRKSTSQHGRFKRQTGGHGQFGDVHIDIKPLPRGSGFNFSQTISGGVVPRQYIPAVESGVKDYMNEGPLGFPVVDMAVTLTDGSYHQVDSSEMAFKQAARIAMTEGMSKCDPVLLEPIYMVRISVPSAYTSRAQRLISGRRGQFLGFDARPGWKGWDEVSANMPQSEIRDLINELRSLSLGVGTFTYRFDHLQEITGKLADQVIEQRQAANG